MNRFERGRDGTEEAPYQINSLSRLLGFSRSVAEGNSYEGQFFELTRDLDLGGLNLNHGSWNPIGWYQNAEEMDGEITCGFRGTFDGAGHTIKGLKIADASRKLVNAGLFGWIDGGTVKNLEIKAANISGEGNLGILAGRITGNAVIYNVKVSGFVHGETGNAGGLAAVLEGDGERVTVENCRAENVVVNSEGQDSFTGGIAGAAKEADLVDCLVSTQNGTADRITLRSRMAQALNTPDHSPLDQYVFTVNTTSGEMRTAQNLGNSIYAFSPDGRQILLALTRKDEQGQYESFLFRYRNGELQEVGSFAQDIRKIWVQNGQITTGRNSDDIIFAEPNMTGANTILDSRNSDGTPSGAYVETLQEKISADMVAGKLPFVVTSVIRENPLRLEVELTEMTDENIKIIRSYETNGSAITFAQSSGNVQELQHNNDSQSQIAPQISKEDEND